VTDLTSAHRLALSCLCLAFIHSPVRAAEPTPLSEILVQAAPADAAASGYAVAGAQIVAATEPLQAALARRLPGAVLSDTQGDAFTGDLQFRGFSASPTAGRPQGLAVYQGGARLNEPFGDTVDWDLVPEIAIAGADLQTQSPAFGLNALAGALSLKMKSGFDGGSSVTARGGSFGRAFGSAELARAWDDTAVYLAIEAGQDEGWRLHSPSQILRGYGDLAVRSERGQLRLSLTGADNRLSGVGPTPTDLLAADRRAVFTWPQTTHNAAGLATLAGLTRLGGWTLNANLYVRRFDQQHLDGNDGAFEGCSGNRANPLFATLCLENDPFPSAIRPPAAAFQVQTLAGAPIPCPAAVGAARPCSGVAYGSIDRTRTGSTTWGGGVEAARQDGRNSLTLGLSATASRARFSSDSTLGVIQPDLSVIADPAVPGAGQRIRTAGALAYSPVGVSAAIDTQGLYFTDTVALTRRWSATVSGRWNGADIRLLDLTGASPLLNGAHRYQRFDPAASLAFQATPRVRLYGGYAEANRAPTPLELGCSDPARPCLLENALVADPPLKQVVARSFEAGVKADRVIGGLSLSGAAYRIDSDDDILALPSVILGRGSYANVPRTRRRGIELSADYASGPVSAYANYGLVEATYQFSAALPSPNAPFADAGGLVAVHPGSRIGGVAPQTFKAGVEVEAAKGLTLGSDVVAVGAQPYAGDEAGQDSRLPGYAIVSLHGALRLGRATLFARVDNLLDSRAASFGTYAQTDSLANVKGAPALSDPHSLVTLQPRSLQAGITVRW
jgi:iron complex outermembrane receptor protein